MPLRTLDIQRSLRRRHVFFSFFLLAIPKKKALVFRYYAVLRNYEGIQALLVYAYAEAPAAAAAAAAALYLQAPVEATHLAISVSTPLTHLVDRLGLFFFS